MVPETGFCISLSFLLYLCLFSSQWTPEGRRLVTGASSGEFTLWNGLTFNFETILQVCSHSHAFGIEFRLEYCELLVKSPFSHIFLQSIANYIWTVLQRCVTDR